MLIDVKDTLKIANIVNQCIQEQQLSRKKFSKISKLDPKTVKKVLRPEGTCITVQTLEKLIAALGGEAKKQLKKIQKKYNSELNLPKQKSQKKKVNRDTDKIKDAIIELIHMLGDDDDELGATTYREKDTAYLANRKVGCFNSELEARTFLISKMWEFNNIVSDAWKDFQFILELNEQAENKRVQKGLLTVAKNLKEIATKIEKSIEEQDDSIITIKGE